MPREVHFLALRAVQQFVTRNTTDKVACKSSHRLLTSAVRLPLKRMVRHSFPNYESIDPSSQSIDRSFQLIDQHAEIDQSICTIDCIYAMVVLLHIRSCFTELHVATVHGMES